MVVLSQAGKDELLMAECRYHFPANTIFTWNSWHIALSEHKDALRFWPERWLDAEVQGNGAESDEGMKRLEDPLAGHWSFGAGRRVCTGYHVGDTNVWIAVARLLYCFNVEEDKVGQTCTLNIQDRGADGMQSRPIDTLNLGVQEHRRAPFAVKLRPRSEQHARLVERVGMEALATRY